MLSVIIVACSDDTDFSTDFNHRLAFSSDTICFDTIFTTLGSPRGGAMVYNRNGKDLRITSAVLAEGGASGFRVMVDGQYGTAMHDLEVRSGDSLYVFAEVTPAENGEEQPVKISDKLVFTLESGVQQAIDLVAYGRDVKFMKALTVSKDYVMKSGHYVVYDSLVVSPDATLVIEPGATLYFHDNVPLVVRGTLSAVGTKEKPVIFRGDRTDRIFSYLPYDRLPGQWSGVLLASTSNGNVLEYCDIHSANYGIRMEAGDSTVQRLTMNASRLENFYGHALELVQAHADVTNSLISNAGGNCVKIVGGNVNFTHCTIANFFVYKVRDVALSLHNYYSSTAAPLYAANFRNCIITGSRSDEVMGYFSDLDGTEPNCKNYYFENTLINTIVPEDDDHFVNVLVDNAETSPFAGEHFATIDHGVFYYDFHLSEGSAARSLGGSDVVKDELLHDKDGVERSAGFVDAGCYQYVAVEEGK